MINDIINELIREDKLGETWKLELAKKDARFSFSSKKSGNENWAKKLASNLIKKNDSSNEYDFIGIYSEGESTEGPIVDGYIYFCTPEYYSRSAFMHRDKKKACKQNMKTGKVIEYFED